MSAFAETPPREICSLTGVAGQTRRAKAREIMHPDQAPFLDRLLEMLKEGKTPDRVE
jgi:hypothetical protein